MSDVKLSYSHIAFIICTCNFDMSNKTEYVLDIIRLNLNIGIITN